MNIQETIKEKAKKFHFFDRDGYELNFNWNNRGYW